MAHRSDPPWSPLCREMLEQVMSGGEIGKIDLELLRWTTWLSLLSVGELTRIVKVDGRAFDEKTIAAHLLQLSRLGLAASVALSEPGWPRGQHRYHITDLGLYALVSHYPEPISVPRLVACYPVARIDLVVRLTRPIVHLALSDLVSRLIAETPPGHTLTSYQQPWKQAYDKISGDGRQTWTCDAAFLLQTPQGGQHAFYVRVDQPECLFSQTEAKRWLSRLFALRQSQQLRGGGMPHLLLLTTPARFPFWAEQISHVSLLRRTSLPSGCIADYGRLAEEGAYASTWLPLHELVEGRGREPGSGRAPLLSLLDRPASPDLVKQFSGYFSFQHLLISRMTGPLSRRNTTLPRYVGDSLHEEARRELWSANTEDRAGVAAMLSEELYGNLVARLRITALLNLLLTRHQKALLASLAHHPHLSLPDLLALLHPESQDERLIQRQLDPLLMTLKLAHKGRTWEGGVGWRERERYQPSETGLRFLAMRHGLSPAYYLTPEVHEEQAKQDKKKKKKRVSPRDASVTWMQRGAKLLWNQMCHTHALYRCIRAIIAWGERSGAYRVIAWKSTRESALCYFDSSPNVNDWRLARPDAELLFVRAESTRLESVFIEYDRATTYDREYSIKFGAYSRYQRCTRTTLPPILAVLQYPYTANTMRTAIRNTGAYDVPVVMVQETDLAQRGLLEALAHA